MTGQGEINVFDHFGNSGHHFTRESSHSCNGAWQRTAVSRRGCGGVCSVESIGSAEFEKADGINCWQGWQQRLGSRGSEKSCEITCW